MGNKCKHFQGLEKYSSEPAEITLCPIATEVCYLAGPNTTTPSASSWKAVTLN